MAKNKGGKGKSGSTQAAINQQAATTQPAAATATPVSTATPKGTAAPASTSTSALSASATNATVSRKDKLREAAERKRRQQNMWVGIGAAVVVIIVAVAIYFSYRNSQPVVGETTFPTQGNLHIPLGSVSPTPYNSTPPTTGPHFENLAAWGIQGENVRYEHLIHNLEDAGVVVYYQCEDGCPELVAELEAIVQPYYDAGRHVVLARNDPTWVENGQQLHKDMGARIAVAAWRKLKLMDEVDADAIRTFIERYEGIDHHRG